MRARNAKPGLFQNADLADRGPACQMLFLGLSLLADREGRLKDDHRWIKASVFPYYDPVQFGGHTVEELLRYLADDQDREHPFIIRYQVGKSKYIQIVNFKRHNSPHNTEKASTIPPAPPQVEQEVQGDPTGEPTNHNGESTVKGLEVHETVTVIPDNSNGEKSPDSLIHRLTDSLTSDSPIHRITDSTLVSEKRERPADAGSPESCPHQAIIKLYHEVLPEFSRVIEWNDERQKYLRARWREKPERQSLDWWKGFFMSVRDQPFLMGQGDKGWMPDLEWLIRPRNFAKVVEGRYRQRASPRAQLVGRAGQVAMSAIQQLRKEEGRE